MSFVVAGASGLSCRRIRRAPPSRRATSNLLLLYLSATSLCIPAASAASPTSSRLAGFCSQRTLFSQPTCPAVRTAHPASQQTRHFHPSPANASSAAHFSYHIAASYSAKGNKFNAAANIFRPEPFDASPDQSPNLKSCKTAKNKLHRPRSGQDAFFHSQVGTTSSQAFGVADGVGGWMDSGIDPADFSHGLTEYMACAARAWPREANQTATLHPKDLLQISYDQVIEDKKIIGGGSTACLAVAEPDGKVEVANLGDSGFMHIGLNAVRHFTHPQTHAFNTPYQLSKTPEKMMIQMAIFGGASALSDLPKESSVTNHQVRHGDVLVFATDGVWDNLSLQDTLGIVSRQMIDVGAWVEREGTIEVSAKLADLVQAGESGRAGGSALQTKLAVAIAKEAKETGLDTRRDGPFAKEVQKHYPHENWHGGKPDDIAVVIAVVVEN